MSDPWYRALLELTDVFNAATVDFWRTRRVRAAYLPVTTGSVSSPMGIGSDSTPVAVEVAGVKTYLADSMQFLLEYGCRLSEAGCYYVMPSFRGESADDSHLCQFFHSEAEVPGGLEDVQGVVQEYLRHLATSWLEHAADTIRAVAGADEHVRALRDEDVFSSIRFEQAVALTAGDPALMQDLLPGVRTLTRAGERRVMEVHGPFTWVTHSDHLSVPFYQAFEEGDASVALNGDLLFGIGETVGCGERHRTAVQLREALRQHAVDEADYAWYVRMRELAPMRTAGFGMGVERVLLWLTKHDDIRDVPLLLRFNGQQINP